jgi:hypothetical protein
MSKMNIPKKVEPALTREEWESVDADRAGEPLTGIGIGYTNGDLRTGDLCNPYTPHCLIALLNHALPDGDPRKITREKVKALRALLDLHDYEACQLADLLESLLPPS